MTFYSPLRYPGGKNRLARYIASICQTNNIDGHYVEPYAGGASVALYLLLEGYVSKVTINDKDRSIYAFWYAILNHTHEFCNLVQRVDINIKNWKKWKSVQSNKSKTDLFELGFSTFFLNRTNISGILDGGPIGGIHQHGRYKIDCRFNKQSLINKIKLIAEHKRDIKVHNIDALDLVKKIMRVNNKGNTIFYFDPPYYLKGQSLYMNYYDHKDHEKVAGEIKKIKRAKWIISYDDTQQIKKLYKIYKKIEYSLRHTAHTSKLGNEVLYFSDNLQTPMMTSAIFTTSEVD